MARACGGRDYAGIKLRPGVYLDPLFFRFKIVYFPFQIFTISVSPPEF